MASKPRPDFKNPPKILCADALMVSVAHLRNHPENARKGDIPAIAESIQENGFYGRLIVQRSTGYILAGNHRFLAGISLGMGEFPVDYVDVDDEQALKLLAVDNSTSDRAEYVLEKQAALLAKLSLMSETGLRGTGYQPKHLEALKAKLAATASPGSCDGGGGRKGDGDDVYAIVLTFASPAEQENYCDQLEDLGLKPRKTVLNERTKIALGKAG